MMERMSYDYTMETMDTTDFTWLCMGPFAFSLRMIPKSQLCFSTKYLIPS